MGVLDEPSDVVITVAGDVIVSDAGTHRVCVFPAGGGPMRAFGEEGREGGQFVRPSSLALVDGTLFVLNRSSGCVQAFR